MAFFISFCSLFITTYGRQQDLVLIDDIPTESIATGD